MIKESKKVLEVGDLYEVGTELPNTLAAKETEWGSIELRKATLEQRKKLTLDFFRQDRAEIYAALNSLQKGLKNRLTFILETAEDLLTWGNERAEDQEGTQIRQMTPAGAKIMAKAPALFGEAKPHVGWYMEQVLQERELSYYAAGYTLGVDKDHLRKVCKGERSMGCDVAAKFSSHFSEFSEDELLWFQVEHKKDKYYHPERYADPVVALAEEPSLVR